MTDDQFDDLVRNAFAHDPGSPNEAVWAKIKPTRWTWLPTVREILVCGAVCAVALLAVGRRIGSSQTVQSEPNPVIQAALHDETHLILSSITRIAGSETPASRAQGSVSGS